jgi:hypothetical protein
MATLKITTINLNDQLFGSNTFTVKLDAWKQTFYFWSAVADADIVLLDGFNLADLAHDQLQLAGQHAGNGPLVIEFGGAFYKGKPIQLDDQITFQCDKFGEDRQRCRMLCVKQYFVEDRPGPDRLISDQLAREVSAPRRQVATRPAASRPTRPTSSRPVRRETFDR